MDDARLFGQRCKHAFVISAINKMFYFFIYLRVNANFEL